MKISVMVEKISQPPKSILHSYLYSSTSTKVITAMTEIMISEFATVCQMIVPALERSFRHLDKLKTYESSSAG